MKEIKCDICIIGGGLSGLLTAYALSITKKDIQLLIVGHCMNKDYLDQLETMISKYELEERVSIIPFIESPMDLMPLLDLVILPTYEETFGLVVAESMLMGTPVIGSNAGGVPEIIEDQVNGLLFEPKNYTSLKEKIIKLYESPELRKKLSYNAKMFARDNYDYRRHFSNLENILNNSIDALAAAQARGLDI